MNDLIPKLSKFQWCQTCSVQFNIYHNDYRIAYFRFRDDILSVNNYDRDEIVPIVEQKIIEYYGMD